MKISGFTIIKNAVLNDYPVVEAIRSILPVVDEMIVSIGDCEDNTEELIRSIGSEKIRILHSVWDPALRKGGKVLAVETDKAMKQIAPDADWAFYIQADEVVPEQYHAAIRDAALMYKEDKRVEGLLFNYLHFYGTYDYTGDSRKWYNKEIRIIRNDPAISAFRDAQGFRKGNKRLQVKQIPAYVYHYGWVKSPELMKRKLKNTGIFWHGDNADFQEYLKSEDYFDFNDFDSLQPFNGQHPAVMQERVSKGNPAVQLDISKKKFSLKKRVLYWFEKKTGIRPFSFRNYRVI
ncbi:MAG: glycosyltransferase family 2 protein [Sphingobacteriales bacterium]|nr:glycosyltransferase family 2 protein [Sphingobacteriales bacterium]